MPRFKYVAQNASQLMHDISTRGLHMHKHVYGTRTGTTVAWRFAYKRSLVKCGDPDQCLYMGKDGNWNNS